MGTQQITILNNPVRDDLRFHYRMVSKGMITIEVYNSTGVLLYSEKEYGTAGLHQFAVPAQKIADKGSYLVQVTTEQMRCAVARAIRC